MSLVTQLRTHNTMIPNHKDHRISVIYRATHLACGLIYVGSACDFYRRYRAYTSYATGGSRPRRYFESALAKHGISAFEFEILERVDDQSCLLERETYWISALRATDQSVGYNMCPAAGTWLGKRHSAAARIKMAKTARSENGIASRKNHPAVIEGRKRGLETWLRRCRKPVYQIDMVTLAIIKEYASPSAAARDLDINQSGISKVAHGQSRCYKGFHWAFKADYNQCGFTPRQKKTSTCNYRRPVRQLTLEGDLIKVWASAADAQRSLGYSNTTICEAGRGDQKTAFGFRWEYVTDDQESAVHRQPKKMGYRRDLHLKIKPIHQLDLAGNIVKTWTSGREIELGYATYCTNPSPLPSIHKSLKTGKAAYGFVWQYVTDSTLIDQIREQVRISHATEYGQPIT